MMVVDASVAIAWCIEAESTDVSVAMLDRLQDYEGVVPAIWPPEVANALLAAERRGRLTPALTEQALQRLTDLPIAVVDRPLPDAFGMVLALARQEFLSAYDASYLSLAMQQGCSLVTLDRRMRAAAERLGIPLAERATGGA